MSVARIYPPQSNHLPDFTQFITGGSESKNNSRTVFAEDLNVDVINFSTMAHNCTDVFHRYSYLFQINLPAHLSPSDGKTISSIDHIWHNLNSKRGSYAISPSLSLAILLCV